MNSDWFLISIHASEYIYQYICISLQLHIRLLSQNDATRSMNLEILEWLADSISILNVAIKYSFLFPKRYTIM